MQKIFSRRSFIGNIAKGSLYSIAFSSSYRSFANPSSFKSFEDDKSKKINIGIIGAENSHTAAFGKLFNIDNIFPGLEVKYVWGETEAFARIAMKKGNIPNIVSHPNDMLGKIDALIVDHRHGKYHLDAAMPFLEEGIPIFIDKPFCYRKQKGEEFLSKARQLKTPVTSYSSIAHSFATFDIKNQISQMESKENIIMYGPLDLESKYGGVFFYGPHLIEPLIYIIDNRAVKVRVNKNNSNGSASIVFENGISVTLIFSSKNRGWQTFVETKKGFVEIKATVEKKVPSKSDLDMVTMFKTGKEPRKHSNILHGIAILEALEKSVNSGGWENVDQ